MNIGNGTVYIVGVKKFCKINSTLGYPVTENGRQEDKEDHTASVAKMNCATDVHEV